MMKKNVNHKNLFAPIRTGDLRMTTVLLHFYSPPLCQLSYEEESVHIGASLQHIYYAQFRLRSVTV
jgi:hypothetical protein